MMDQLSLRKSGIEHRGAQQKEGLEGLVLYHPLTSLPLFTRHRLVRQLLASPEATPAQVMEAYCRLVAFLLEALDRLPWQWPGEGFTALVLMEVLKQENLFSLWAEQGRILLPHPVLPPAEDGTISRYTDDVGADGGQREVLTAQMLKLAAEDLALLEPVARLSNRQMAVAVAEKVGVGPNALPDWNLPGLAAGKPKPPREREMAWAYFLSQAAWAGGAGLLADYYRQNGAGCLGRYFAFRWEDRLLMANRRPPVPADEAGTYALSDLAVSQDRAADSLRPVIHRDPVTFAQLRGYEAEHRKLIANTQQFLAGLPANNVLLYGDRGTGKSSAIKALLNQFGPGGLRLVEMTKAQLADLPLLLEYLKDRGLRFIIFIDDLSFLEQDGQYAALKAVLEGGLAVRPDNVLIYATSNRRHLLPEKFQDRQLIGDEDLRTGDTLQEKLSLADRFGLTITFLSPDQKGYLGIVEELAAARGLAISGEALIRRALEWEIRQNLRSPRTARQFIDQLTGELAMVEIANQASDHAGQKAVQQAAGAADYP